MTHASSLAARVACLDQWSQGHLASASPLSEDERHALAQQHGLTLPADVPTADLTGLEAVPEWAWDRPRDPAELAQRVAALQTEVARLTRARAINDRWAFLSLGAAMVTAIGCAVGFSWHDLESGWGALGVTLALASMTLGMALLPRGFIKGIQISIVEHDLSEAGLTAATPTRHDLKLWSMDPRVMAYLKHCLASPVGLLEKDVAVMSRILHQGFPEDRTPVPPAELRAAVTV